MTARQVFWRSASAVAIIGLGSGAVFTASLAPERGASQAHLFDVDVDSSSEWLVCGPGYVDPANLTVEPEPATMIGATGVTLEGGAQVASARSGQVFAVGEAPEGVLLEECVPPANQLALVGGSTTGQEEAVLVVANPGSTPVDVTARVFGADGELVGPAAALTIPAGATESWLVEAWTGQQERLGITLDANGRGVAAWLQTSGLSGEVSMGTARLQGTALAKQLVFPIVDESAGTPTLQLLNPSDKEIVAAVSVVKDDQSEPLLGAENVRIPAGVVADLTLAGIGEDPVAIVVDSDVAITGSISQSIRGQADPVVKDQRLYTRSLTGPAVATSEPTATETEPLTEALEAAGLDNVKVQEGQRIDHRMSYVALRFTGTSSAGTVTSTLNLGTTGTGPSNQIVRLRSQID